MTVDCIFVYGMRSVRRQRVRTTVTVTIFWLTCHVPEKSQNNIIKLFFIMSTYKCSNKILDHTELEVWNG